MKKIKKIIENQGYIKPSGIEKCISVEEYQERYKIEYKKKLQERFL